MMRNKDIDQIDCDCGVDPNDVWHTPEKEQKIRKDLAYPNGKENPPSTVIAIDEMVKKIEKTIKK